jgi:hypothetical protein
MNHLFKKDDEFRKFPKYFVLYKIDNKITKKFSYSGVELYNNIKYFGDVESAKRFAYNNLPARIGQRHDINTELQDQDYIVVGEFIGKYKSYCGYDDPSPMLTTYDAVRCKKSQIEEIVNFFSSEKDFNKVEIGIETKLF